MFALIIFFLFMMFISQYFICFFAPIEKNLGVVQKIFYLHLPLAWWSFVAFFIVFIFSILHLLKKRERYFLLAGSFAELGVLFSSLMLLTGIFWARASWNTWWTWDPRLTTALIMWFLYMAYLIIRSDNRDSQKIIASCIGVIAFLDIPLVFLAARLWRSIHPAVFSSKGGIDPQMGITLLISFTAWGFLFFLLAIFRIKILKINKKVDEFIYKKI